MSERYLTTYATNLCPVVGHPAVEWDGSCPECDILEDRGEPTPGYADFLAGQRELMRSSEAYRKAFFGDAPFGCSTCFITETPEASKARGPS